MAHIPGTPEASPPRQESLHCTVEAVPSHWRFSPTAPLHSEGPSHECGRRARYRVGSQPDKVSPDPRAIWLTVHKRLGRRPPGSTPQPDNGVRHGPIVSRLPHSFYARTGGGKTLGGCSGMCPWALGDGIWLLSLFFSPPPKKHHTPIMT